MTSFDVTIADPKARVRAFLNLYQPAANGPDYPESFETSLMRDHLTVVSVEQKPRWTAVFEMRVPDEYCSRSGNIHGGAVATILDMCTSAAQAPVARKGYWEFGGVSRMLSTTYLRPMPLGLDISIECEVMQVGKSFATIQARFFDKRNGKLLATGEHNKAHVDTNRL